MNTNILIKCIKELEKDVPNLAYVRGILETLVELDGISTSGGFPALKVQSTVSAPIVPIQTELSEEEQAQRLLEQQYVGGKIANLQ